MFNSQLEKVLKLKQLALVTVASLMQTPTTQTSPVPRRMATPILAKGRVLLASSRQRQNDWHCFPSKVWSLPFPLDSAAIASLASGSRLCSLPYRVTSQRAAGWLRSCRSSQPKEVLWWGVQVSSRPPGGTQSDSCEGRVHTHVNRHGPAAPRALPGTT